MIPLLEALCGSVSAFNYIVEELARREVDASQRLVEADRIKRDTIRLELLHITE